MREHSRDMVSHLDVFAMTKERESLFDALRHDAEIEAGREDGDCLLSSLEYHEGILAVLEAAHRARYIAIPYVVDSADSGDQIAEADLGRLRNAFDKIGLGNQ